MTILCNLQNINLAFGQKVIFEDAKLSISMGDKIGLIGLNGHGKSTLFNILSNKVNPDISKPPFIFDKNNENFHLFYIPQELEINDFADLDIPNFYLSFYPTLYKIHKELAEVQAVLAEDYSNEKMMNKQQDLMDQFEANQGWDIENSYLNYLALFELDHKDRPVAKLSGGEQRKIALSVGLSSKATLVLWDEPTNHLDVETIEKFEDELNSSSATYMIISHDRYLLNHVTNRIVHIERGNINSYSGTYLDYLEYLEEREKELAKNLDKLQNKHRRELAWMRQGVKARGTRSKKRVDGYNNIKSDISDLKARARKVTELNLTHTGRKSKELVQIKEASFSYNNDVIFSHLNFSIYKKDKIALIGPNGAGKTTLINILKGDLPLSTGTRKALDQLKVITFDQKRESLDMNKTPFDIAGDGQDFVHLGDGTTKHVISYLEDFLFTRDQINRPVYTLSGGEKNRLQLAMFMRQSADLWIFDEPTNDLDIETIEILENELSNYNAAVLIIGHDRAFLDNTCKTTWLVHNKEIEVFEGGYSQVAPYLQAIELEKKMSKKGQDNSPKKVEVQAEVVSSNIVKMSYNEKKRWKTIENDVAKQETEVEKLKKQLASFDFTSPTEEQTKEYEKMNAQFLKSEKKLSKLYEEWEDLSAKEI
ncbi:MAG: ATP-binding cassette subfamily F protein uup [Bacteriovoracaceae bacterium]|jgi:ATP-binding cassette subfamily F protein uup